MGEVILSSSGMTIKAGGSFELPIKVDCPSVLRIRFEVEDGYDVDFSLKFLENADKAEVQTLVEPARSTAREGQLDIHTTGTCFVIWDNAFSWINSKELTYHLSLKSKEDIEKERVAELARLAELRKQAAIDGAAARREKRAEMVVELEGKVADMMAHQHQARNRLAAKQVELKELERRYLAAKAGIEAVAQVVRAPPPRNRPVPLPARPPLTRAPRARAGGHGGDHHRGAASKALRLAGRGSSRPGGHRGVRGLRGRRGWPAEHVAGVFVAISRTRGGCAQQTLRGRRGSARRGLASA